VTRKNWRQEIEDGAVVEQVHITIPYTVVIARYGMRTACGVAKCNPRDKWNDTLGLTIARGRAIKRLADETWLAICLAA